MGRAKTVLSVLKEAFADWKDDDAPRLGAALAYYTVFSLAPLLVVAIAIAGLAFGHQAAQGAEHRTEVGNLGRYELHDLWRRRAGCRAERILRARDLADLAARSGQHRPQRRGGRYGVVGRHRHGGCRTAFDHGDVGGRHLSSDVGLRRPGISRRCRTGYRIRCRIGRSRRRERGVVVTISGHALGG